MPLHLYALAEAPVRLPDVRGIGGGALAVVSADGVDAIVSEADAAEPSEAAVLAHADVVEQTTVQNDAVLPVRFGASVPSESDVVDAISDRRDAIRANLARVRGCVEIGLRVVREAPGQDAGVNPSGRDYMLGRLAEVQAAERLADEIHGPLAEAARESTHQVLVTPELVLSAAYLIPRDEVETFRGRVNDLEQQRADAQVVCTGPWPPYSFALIDSPNR